MPRSTAILALASSLLLSACMSEGSGPSETRLQGGEWRVEDIGGRGVVDNSPATLLFGADGQLSGNASCNRLIATYTVQGDEIAISPGGVTMMACPPALMDQERKLLDLLEAVDSYRFDETGALVLASASGEEIIARR